MTRRVRYGQRLYHGLYKMCESVRWLEGTIILAMILVPKTPYPLLCPWFALEPRGSRDYVAHPWVGSSPTKLVGSWACAYHVIALGTYTWNLFDIDEFNGQSFDGMGD